MKNMDMIVNLKPLAPAIPPHDYRPALQSALSWLGKRYLLAEPLNPRRDDSKTVYPDLQRA